jgi:hypothetical protein
LWKIELASEGLEPRVGAKGFPVPSDGEVFDGSFMGVDSSFEPGERQFVLSSMGI